MIDLLAMINSEEITPDKAQRIFDKTIEKIQLGLEPSNWSATLGMSNFESTAYLQGATLEEIAKLRYEGWPEFCISCHSKLDYTKYGWFIQRKYGKLYLVHLECSNIGKQGK